MDFPKYAEKLNCEYIFTERKWEEFKKRNPHALIHHMFPANTGGFYVMYSFEKRYFGT